MTHHLRFVAVVAVLTALAQCAPVQAQTSWVDEQRVRAEAGDAQAQFGLGRTYEYGFINVPEDADVLDAEAARWLRLAAEQGHADAQNYLGDRYWTGEGVPQDYAEAVHWYRLAAYQGVAEAQYFLGVL